MIQYTLRYHEATHRRQRWVYSDEHYVSGWEDGEPETIEIHFYRTVTEKRKGFFGIGAREFKQQYWLNNQQIEMGRQEDETRTSWLARVNSCAAEKLNDLEAARVFKRIVEKQNNG